jgi:hypothetical protein
MPFASFSIVFVLFLLICKTHIYMYVWICVYTAIPPCVHSYLHSCVNDHKYIFYFWVYFLIYRTFIVYIGKLIEIFFSDIIRSFYISLCDIIRSFYILKYFLLKRKYLPILYLINICAIIACNLLEIYFGVFCEAIT